MACLLDRIKRTTLVCCLSLLFIYLFSSCRETEIIIDPEPEPLARIMIVPDIQNYTYLEERFKYLTSIVNYYRRNKEDFDAVFQVGDLTYHNYVWQYENAYNYFFRFFDVEDQLVFCLGNHDYGTNGLSDIRNTNIPPYMIPASDLRMVDKDCENYVRYVTLGGVKYGVIELEFATRNKALEWANDVLSNDASTPYIILLHVFLNKKGFIYDYKDPNILISGSHKQYEMSSDGDNYKNDSREIFDKIVYKNPNVKLIICGHSLTPDYVNVVSEKNVLGKPVYIVMVNYQHYGESGNGYIGELDIEGEHYRIRSYSTYDNNDKYGNVDISFGPLI